MCRCIKPEGTYGGVKCPSRRPLTTKDEVFKKFEPKRVDSLLYAMIEFFNHGTQWGANCPLSPTLLLDLRLEAGYTFAPFGGAFIWEYCSIIIRNTSVTYICLFHVLLALNFHQTESI